MTDCSLCATCYNEVEDVDGSVKKLCEVIRGENWEFIVVDGGSTDGTVSRLRELEEEYDFLDVHVHEGANIGEGRRIASEVAGGDVIVQLSDVDSEWFGDGRLPAFVDLYREHGADFVLKGRGVWVYTPEVLEEIGSWRPLPVAEERDLERRALRKGKMRFCDVRLRGSDTQEKTLLERAKRSYDNAKVKLGTGVSLRWMIYVWWTRPKGILPKIAALTIFPLAKAATLVESYPYETYDDHDEFVFRIGEVTMNRHPELWVDRPGSWEYERWKDV